jgi:fatty acid desaturase
MAAAIPGPKVQRIPGAANLFKALLLIALLAATFALAEAGARWLAARGGDAATTALTWGWLLALGVLATVWLIGMGVLAHDAVHRVLFRSPFWNEFWGGVLSAFTLIPFYTNRQIHLTHHSYAHQPGLDPENTLHHHRFWIAATLGSLLALAIHLRYLGANLLRLSDPRYRGRVLKDLLFLTGAGAFYFWLVPALGGSPMHTLVPVLIMFPLLFAIRALSDHYGVPAIERTARKREDVLEADEAAWHAERARRVREISGWVVRTHPWLEWLWSHVNYHEVHHKYPWLSHIHLPQAFAATRATQPYLVVDGYWRSFWNLRRWSYYGRREDVRPYLSTPDF